ncbi:(2Fe-2S) ferredoxin domain-containing protein [Brasilonema sp. UFV-L1]|uniref:(2Fe-2S) ferredoxin domain-containing protein n=1 Tax=Brasilonema sp. UFV-L1 TaxID=2234130 RepID=UPI00145EC6A7|nr:(2Fe-2S) ferredoxin domain-containing protein [Brasilonema sp. UFV-L1]NMG09675.1 (2Fe-2S) ferredoxin domain-containing protein [Brasilonema sp. UFV-L1]
MSKSYITDVSEFCIEGKFLDFVIKDGYKLKGLRLETAEGECYVKLAKHLRAGFDLRLPPGTWLQVVGEKKYDFKTGEVKLKAQQVMAAGTLHKNGAMGRLGDGEKRVTTSPQHSITPSTNNAKSKKTTILVCQKSDCIKRGGREVCQALEAALSARGLESEVTIKGTGCMKDCKAGPNLVMPDKTRYSRMKAAQVPALMDKHFATDSNNGKQDQGSEVTIPN